MQKSVIIYLHCTISYVFDIVENKAHLRSILLNRKENYMSSENINKVLL